MMKSLNARIFWCWTLYCIVGCSLLPEMVMSARYLPTRRSMPTQLERNERLRELFQHVSAQLHNLFRFHFSCHNSIFCPPDGLNLTKRAHAIFKRLTKNISFSFFPRPFFATLDSRVGTRCTFVGGKSICRSIEVNSEEE